MSGIYALRESDDAAAARHFAALTRLRPDFAQGFFLAGEANRNLGRQDIAAGAYQRALALDANLALARAGLGWSRLLSGDVAAAAAAWRPIVTSVEDSTTLSRMEAVFDQVGDLQSARLARAAAARNARPAASAP